MIGTNISFAILTFITLVHLSRSLTTYSDARNVRVKLGHDAAVALYKELLEMNADDMSAAIRIASARSSPKRHDLACPDIRRPKVKQQVNRLRIVLGKSSYNHTQIQKLFGVRPLTESESRAKGRDITKNEALGSAFGPVYIKPVVAGSQSGNLDLLLNSDNNDSSLKCLVAMFILGLSVPKDILSSKLVGGDDTIFLFEELGIAFPCETDPSVIVPYVQIFPMDIPDPSDHDIKKTLTLVTDMHPSVLTTTTLGEMNDGAVMYIGPDSLALVQHFPMELYINRKQSGEISRTSLQILDFCTGSGVQALSILKALEVSHPNCMATCVDLNDRALRFTNFNAALNGISMDRIKCIRADLLRGKILESRYASSRDEGCMLLKDVLANNGYDIVTANPPFIPVPCPTDQIRIHGTINDISKRYGLFSSGGSSGEEVLQKIIQWAPLLLRKKHGILAVVSEFMNPPHENNRDNTLIEKLISWWHSALTCDKTGSVSGVGIVFTNEFPVPAEVYASRRADNEAERVIWTNHLKDSHIRSISPGLLYIQTGEKKEGSQYLCMESKLVPQSSNLGSIWTPYNFKAVEFTKAQWRSSISKWDKAKTI